MPKFMKNQKPSLLSQIFLFVWLAVALGAPLHTHASLQLVPHNESCNLCVVQNNQGHAITSPVFSAVVPIELETGLFSFKSTFVSILIHSPYSSRAPPTHAS